jgi:hypothetical protein
MTKLHTRINLAEVEDAAQANGFGDVDRRESREKLSALSRRA